MNVTIPQAELRKLQYAMRQQVTKLRRNANVVFQRTVKSLAKNLIEFTPPRGIGLDARKQVEHKVERDAKKAVDTFDDIKNPSIAASFNNYKKRKNYNKATELLQKVTKQSKFKVVPFSPTYHEEDRSHSILYKVKLSGRITFDDRKLARYIKAVQKKAGSLKASWMPFVRKIEEVYGIKVPVPSWVKRNEQFGSEHTTATGRAGNNPEFVIESHAPTIAHAEKYLRTAIDYAANALLRDVQYLNK